MIYEDLFEPIDIRSFFPTNLKVKFRISDQFYEGPFNQVQNSHWHYFCQNKQAKILKKIIGLPVSSLNERLTFPTHDSKRKTCFFGKTANNNIVGFYKTSKDLIFSNTPNKFYIKNLAEKNYDITLYKLQKFSPYIHVEKAKLIIALSFN